MMFSENKGRNRITTALVTTILALTALGLGTPGCSDSTAEPGDAAIEGITPGTDASAEGVTPDAVPDALVRDTAQSDVAAPDAAMPDTPVPDTAQPDTAQPDVAQPDLTPADSGTVVPGTWVKIPAGTFSMGSPASESCRYSDEDQHAVTLTHEFELQATEVTQGQYQALMGTNPSRFSNCGSTCPVEQVSWHMAAAYANALSAQKGFTSCYTCTGTETDVSCESKTAYAGAAFYTCPGYRLPTEAEWEYAYRAGTTTAYYNGTNDSSACRGCSKLDANLDKIAWYYANSAVTYAGCHNRSSCGGRCLGTHPVGQKQANAWHLYDMAGNVWEWCHDWYQNSLGSAGVTDPVGPSSGSYRVNRGECWFSNAYRARAANRDYTVSGRRAFNLGFRLARSVP